MNEVHLFNHGLWPHVSGGGYPHQPEYYRAAVAVLRSRWGEDCEVVVVSDDMAWCRDNIRSTQLY